MRKKLIAGNWKMHHTGAASIEFLDTLLPAISSLTAADVLIAPSFTALWQVAERIKGQPVILAAQNLYHEEKGAFTGEVSVSMLKDCGCQAVIIGHSERRHVFGETDDLLNKKVQAGLGGGLHVIFCVGETETEREAGQTRDVINRQLRLGLQGLERDKVADLTIAYEPVWAIGTDKNATPEQAEEVHCEIRAWVAETFGMACGEQMRVLYGGSVKPENSKELLSKSEIDGLLVGSASLDPQSFCAIIRNVQ